MDYFYKNLIRQMNPHVALSFGILLLTGASALAQNQNKPPRSVGKVVYDQNCLTCHSADGTRVPKIAPSLIKVSNVLGDKSKLVRIILEGMKDVAIEGETYEEPMPAFAALSDDEIAAVLTYIRSNFTNQASAISKEEVAMVRRSR